MSDRGQTQSSFWDVDASGREESDGGDGRSTWEMGGLAMYLTAGWDFAGEKANGTQDLWYMPVERGYPRLTWELAAGDFNEDGRVDFHDYGRLASKWKLVGTDGDSTIPMGVVDFNELMTFTDLWLSGSR